MHPDTPDPAADTEPVAVPGAQEASLPRDEYQRLAADFDNFKKRARRDAERQLAAERDALIGDLLPVLDNLERALASDRSSSSESLHQGVTMTLRQLSRLLQRHGIEAVVDLGRPFDPHRQEAVYVRHDPQQPDQIVLEVTRRGYRRGDEVFRAAQVVVNDRSRSAGESHGG